MAQSIIRGNDAVDSANIIQKDVNGNIVNLKTQNNYVSPFSGFKNYIIDGRFDFWYEGTSQTTVGYGSDTMWSNNNGGSTKTHSRQSFAVGETFPDGTPCHTYFSRTVVNSVAGIGNFVAKDTRIEDVTRLAGKTVTLSFYARADSNKNIAIELIQNFGSGGSPSAQVYGIASQKIALTTAWQKITRTITIPSISSKTLGTDGVHTSRTAIVFHFDAGSNFNSRTDNLGQQSGTFDIAMVQLEEGSVATPFENTDIGTMEMRVNRYARFVRLGLYSNRELAVTIGGSTNFGTPMRATPLMSLWSDNPVSYQNVNAYGLEYYSEVASGLWNNGRHFADARL